MAWPHSAPQPCTCTLAGSRKSLADHRVLPDCTLCPGPQPWVQHPLPCVPRGQEHLYVLVRSMQVPPFWQGWDRHSLISSEQFTPW